MAPLFEEKTEYYESGKIKIESSERIMSKFDENGQLIEEYGKRPFDFRYTAGVKFKSLYFYPNDSTTEIHHYRFNDTTMDFTIKDSSDYDEKDIFIQSPATYIQLVFGRIRKPKKEAGSKLFVWNNHHSFKNGYLDDALFPEPIYDTDTAKIAEVIQWVRQQ
ncbi:MAG: hypothetical protein R3B47_09740 [Bacteroidia bacterium]